MTTQIYIQCIAMGVLGIIAHLLLFKIPAERKRAKAANVPFDLIIYISNDIYAIAGAFVTLAMVIIGIDEIVGYKPAVMGFIKWFFGFVGYTGSSVMVSLFGKFGNKVQQIVDVKTDIADEK